MSKYETICPSATYSPWNTDSEFLKCYHAISGNTLVDIYRCFELWKLVEQSAKLSHGCLLEVGVWRGGTGALIAKRADLCGINNTVFLCDTFTGVVKAGPEDSSYRGKEHSDANSDYVKSLLKKIGYYNVAILEGVFPDETGAALEKEKFRMAHIDVDTYQSAKDITEWVWPRLVHGGVVIYDDYGFESCNGVTKHVEETMGMKDRIVICNLNGHAVAVKL